MRFWSGLVGKWLVLLVVVSGLAVGCGEEVPEENQEPNQVHEEPNQNQNQNQNQEPNQNQNQNQTEVFTVGGEVTGLTGVLELENNGGDTLAVTEDGPFVFETALEDGESYEVTVVTQPVDLHCEVVNGQGVIAGADVTDVEVTCEAQVVEAHFALSVEAESALDVFAGEDVELVVTVTNVGGETGTRDVVATVEGIEVASESLELDSGESETILLSWATDLEDEGSFAGEVTTGDGTATFEGSVTLTAAHFSITVDLLASDLDVVAGEDVELVVEVENLGQTEGTRHVIASVGGSVVDSLMNLELAGGASQVLTLTWGTDVGDEGIFTGEVETGDSTATFAGSVGVTGAFFEVTVDQNASDLDVTAGEEATLVVEVENTGQVQGTRTVIALVEGNVVGAQTGVTIDGGQSQTLTFTWTTTAADGGSFTGEVTTSDDTATFSGSVALLPAHFAVTVNEGASTLSGETGDTLSLVVEVENTGHQSGTRNLVVTLAGDVVAGQSGVQLDGEDSTQVTLTWTAGTAGTFGGEVSTGDDSAAFSVTVDAPAEAFFAVTVDVGASDLNVTAGQDVVLVVEIENLGDAAGTTDVEATVVGDVVASASVTLDGDESETIALSWSTSVSDQGSFSGLVTTDDDVATFGGSVSLAAPYFALTLLAADSALSVLTGEEVIAVVEVENLGDVEATQDVHLLLDGQLMDTVEDVTLSAAETMVLVLGFETDLGDEGSFQGEVATDDEVLEFPVTIDLPLCEAGLWDGVHPGSDPWAEEIDCEAINLSWSCAMMDVEDEVLALVNQRRSQTQSCGGETRNPVAPLTMNSQVQCAARIHSWDMDERGYFDHQTLPEGHSPGYRLEQVGISGGWGEAIGSGSTSAEGMVNLWMSSTGHCNIIMNGAYSEIGIGRSGARWTMKFIP